MQHGGVLFLGAFLAACASGPGDTPVSTGPSGDGERGSGTVHQEPIPSETDEKQPIVGRHNGEIVSISCPIRYPSKVKDRKEISQLHLCENLGDYVSYCEISLPEMSESTPEEFCGAMYRQARRGEEIRESCMREDIPDDQLWPLLDAVGTCAQGPGHWRLSVTPIPCEDQLACIRATGLTWPPLSP